MTHPVQARVFSPAPALLRAMLDGSSEAIVLCSAADDTVMLVNAAARALMPGLEPGAPAVLDKTLTGERRQLDDDHYAWYMRDTSAFEAERSRTAFLAEAGRRLSASLHHRRCLRTTAELAVSQLADAAIVVLPARKRHHEWMRLVSGGTVEEGRLRQHLADQIPGLEEALGGFPPIPSRWLDASQVPPWLLGEEFGPIGALLVTPLPGNAEPAGALILARQGDAAAFSEEDELLARIFAARAGAAISAALLYRDQVDTTAVLQADLLPPELPQPDGIELVGSYQAAKDRLQVGGDFYDVYEPTGERTDTVVVLGDVCGKGTEAAVLTGKVRQTLRALNLVEEDPAVLLRTLNQALLGAGRQHRFVTMVVGSLSRGDHGRVKIDLATGGHPVPLILRADGTVEEAPIKGTLIGVVPDITIRPGTVELAPGETCLLYSDGLPEARGGATGQEQWGEERLHAALASCRGMPGSAVVERLRQLVSDWVHGGVRDDIAMLAVRAPTRTRLSLMDTGAPTGSPFAIDARRRSRNR
jgi:serine phosphatase RsbU (regulator of sigma subunit)